MTTTKKLRGYTNRWYTSDGKAKRIPAAFEKLRYLAIEHKEAIMQEDMITLTARMKSRYNFDLAEALEATIAFMGLYDNESLSHLFTAARYKAGIHLLGIQE